jgi:purine-nucleoside/S-methyl-5'-thioadenosine phosphorylase / adenosine deaminase
MPFVFKVANGLGFYEVSAWEGARAVFTTRPHSMGTGGIYDPAQVESNRAMLAAALGVEPGSLKTVRQVHGADVYILKDQRAETPGRGYDALATNIPGEALGVLTADCVPVLLFDPVSRAVAAVHAGWAGSVRAIAGRTVGEMAERFGSRPSDIKAAIGPSIGPCCYEVDEKVIGPLSKSFEGWEKLAEPTRPGHWRMDLWETNRRSLIGAGLEPGNIAGMGLCTACNQGKFFSHRGSGGNAGRMMAAVLLK